MTPVAVTTIVIVVAIVLTLVGFLIAIARVLLGVQRALGGVIGAVGTIITKTEPVAYVVDSLNGNLDKASGGLTSLLESKVGAAGAAELVASVDPLTAAAAESRPSAPDRSRIRPTSADLGPGEQQRTEPVAQPDELPQPAGRRFPGAGSEIRLGGRPTT